MSNFNEFKYSSFKENSIPESFKSEERTVKLNEDFEVEADWSNKSFKIFKTASFQDPVKVADFFGNTFSWAIPESTCKSCGKCFSSTQQSYKYINNLAGRLLIGYLPVRNGKGDGFSCSNAISTGGYGTYMAFRYGLQIAKKLTGIDYDLLLIDECGEALRPISVISSIREEKKVNLSSTLAIIGTISSDLSENIYQISKSLNTVQISYGSTSAMFDDETLYPNFLRTVPSDDQQAEALIMIIKKFKWNCFHLMFDGTSYGRTGASNVRKYAKIHDLHIYEDREVSSEYLRGIAGFQILKTKKTKIILYFGMSETAKGLLSVFSRTQAIGKYIFVMSESWGDNQEHIRGLQDVPRALISLKLSTPFLRPDDFQEFYRKHISTPDITDPWTVQYMQQNKCEDSKCPKNVQLTQYAQYAFLSVISTAVGVQSSLKKVCNKDHICRKFRSQPEILVRELKKVQIGDEKIFAGRNGRYGYRILNMKRSGDRTFYEQIGTFLSSKNVTLAENSSDASNVDRLSEIVSFMTGNKLHSSPIIARTWAIAATVFGLVLMSIMAVLLFWWKKRTSKIVKKFPTPVNYDEISDIYVQAKKRHIYENLDREIESTESPTEETNTKSTDNDVPTPQISQLKYRLLFGEDPKEESRYSSTPTKEKSITNDLMPLDAGYLERHARFRQSLPLTFDPATRPLPPISERKTPVVKFSTVPKKIGKKMAQEVHANLAFVMDEGSESSLNDESYSEVVL